VLLRLAGYASTMPTTPAAPGRPDHGLDDDQRRRMRSFYLTMAAMAAGIALAAASWFWWHLPWLAVALLVISVPLRWVATLLADANPRARTDRTAAPFHRPAG